MSEGDVSLIQDEDVLRKMWQTTEDQGKKKEIRAHMYKLREERLKTLYAEPTQTEAKSLQFTSSGGHTDSFADQCFQSLKSKEIRDSESPTRDYNFKIPEADNPNEGWTVVSSNEKSDDGKTEIHTTSAHTSGTRNLDGGTANFSGLNEGQKKVTKHEDDNTKFISLEDSSNTVLKENFVSDTGDENISRTAASTVTSSRVQSTLSQKYDSSRDDTDFVSDIHNVQGETSLSKSNIESNVEKRSETSSSRNVSSNDSTIVIDGSVIQLGDGELVSRKVEQPDEFTKIITETRKLDDGTIVTSTSREMKGSYTSRQGKQATEHYDSATSKSISTSEQVASKHLTSHIDNESKVIVADELSEKRAVTQYDNDDVNELSNKTIINENIENVERIHSVSDNINTDFLNNEKVQNVVCKEIRSNSVSSGIHVDKSVEEITIESDTKILDNQRKHEDSIRTSVVEEVNIDKNAVVGKNILVDEIVEVDKNILNIEYPKPEVMEDNIIHNKKTTGEYITTYQTDYVTKKISEDLSPTHNAWASSLRSSSDSPFHGGSPSRSMRGSRSSVSSLRSSISPEKRVSKDHPKKEREPSPKKVSSPTRISSDNSSNKNVNRKNVEDTEDKFGTITKNKKYEILKNTEEETCTLTEKTNDKIKITKGNSKSPVRNDRDAKNGYSPHGSPTRSPERKSPNRASPSKNIRDYSVDKVKKSPDISPTRFTSNEPVYIYKSPSPSPTRNANKNSRNSPYSSYSTSPSRSLSPNKSFNESDKSKDLQTKKILKSRDSSPTTSVSEIEFISGVSNTVNERELSNVTDNKVVRKSSLKKSSIDKTNDTAQETKPKVKPPFVRTETYEERCRKILGMPDKKTLVEGAEKNLSEILGFLPNDKTAVKSENLEKNSNRISPEKELTTGIKSAELIRKSSESEIPIYRKSSLKKSLDMQNQTRNLVDAEFINVDTHGNIVSCGDTPNCKITDKGASERFIKDELNEYSNVNKKSAKKDVEKITDKVTMKIDKDTNIETLPANDVKMGKGPGRSTSPKKISTQKTLSPERGPVKKNPRTISPDKISHNVERTSNFASQKKAVLSKQTTDEKLDCRVVKNKITANDSITSLKKQEPARSILNSQKYNIFKDDKKKTEIQSKTKETITKQITSQKVSDTKILLNRKFDKSKSTPDEKRDNVIKKKNVISTELRDKFNEDSKLKDTHKMHRSVTDTKTTCSAHSTDIKINRTPSDLVMKSPRAEPMRVKSKPEINIAKSSPGKMTNITTKTTTTTSRIINLKSTPALKPHVTKSKTSVVKDTDENHVFIDLQRAKSSRENTPDQICPLPAESTFNGDKVRLPDKVTEPDDFVSKKKIMHQTISESGSNESNIIELSDNENDDECLLSVTEKVSKFSNVDDVKETTLKNDITKYSQRKSITDKVEEILTSDDCLLSVLDKVCKFSNVSDTKKVEDSKQKIAEDFLNREITEDLKNDECLSSVTEKVSHFIKTAEKVTEPIRFSDGPKSKKSDTSKTINRDRSPEKNASTERSPGLVSKASKLMNDVKNSYETTTSDIKLAVQKETVASQAKKSTSENKYVHVKSQITPERTVSPKMTSTPEKIKPCPSPILKSTDTVKKAKALFENIANQTTDDMSQKRSTKLTDIGVYKKTSTIDSIPDIVPKKEIKESSHDLKIDSEKLNQKRDHRKSVDRQSDLIENHFETKVNSINKFSSSATSDIVKESEINTDDFVSTRRGSGKFGVELRRTSTDQSYTSERRRSGTAEPHLQPTIEDIHDLTLLEQMLEKVTGYEQRRRIRTQIRLLKRNHENKTSSSSKIESREISPTRRIKQSVVEKTASSTTTKKISNVSVASQQRSTSPEKKSNAFSPDRNRSTSPKKVSKIESTDNKFVTEIHEEITNPIRTKTSKVSEYTTAYLRRIGASNNLKSEYLPKVPNIRREKEEFGDVEHQSRKSSITVEKSTISKTENRYSTRSPSPKNSQSPTERIYVRTPSPDLKKPRQNQSELQTVLSSLKTNVSSKEPVDRLAKKTDDEKPEWVTSKILSKTSTATKSFSHRKTEDKSKTITRAHSPSKITRKPTDVIISSYGVGPTDENGKPLFGIKALRKSSNPTSTYEVKGTVITRQFRSENGGEPEGEVTMTAYSTDPTDLKKILDSSNNQNRKTSNVVNKAIQDKSTRKGISSITTTTRYGGSTGNPISKIHKTSQPRAIENAPPSEQSTRRGSVKSLTEKFIKNAAETTRVEKSSYPKAGLILRTTSFKDNASGSLSSRSSTPGVVRTDSNNSMNSTEMCTTTVERRSSNKTSFLDNKTKVTGVQDILTRMKNADIIIDDGDTADDAEARALLNKFLGATALMHGMTGYMDEKSQTKQFKQESRTVVSKTSTIAPDIEDIWDERILRKLLEESDDYEERRKLRARLRQVMAEQEACAQIVADAAEESAAGSVELQQQQHHDDGESLPGDGSAMLPEPLLRDVHGALSRLQGALRSGPAPKLHDGALLELVSRLQAGLLAQEPTPPPRSTRRRRLGNTRHTVGVTREELADARKYMENIAFPSDSSAKEPQPEEPRKSPYALQKQASYGNVLSPTFERTNSIPQTPVKNATARPFTLNFQPTKTDLPSPIADPISKLPKSPLRESIRTNKPDDSPLSYFEPAQVHQKQLPVKAVEPIQLHNGYPPKPIDSQSLNSGSDPKLVQDTLIKAAQKKIIDYDDSSDSEDSDCSTVKMEESFQEKDSDIERATPVIIKNNIPQNHTPVISPDRINYNPVIPNGVPLINDTPKNIAENYSVHKECNGFAEPEDKITLRQSKKLKMKRANTIDIPKPANYQVDSDDDADSNRLSNIEFKPTVPQFKPKTDNDRKFLAFIQKHNEDSTSPRFQNSFNNQPQRNGGCNWKSCFGSIKNVFESSTSENANRPLDYNSRSSSVSSAKNFWKSNNDEPVHYSRATNITAKPIKMTSNRPVEQSKYQPKLPWASEAKGEVVTGSLTVSAPKMANGTSVTDKVIKYIPKPAPVNQFSHAPMSAFKPLPKKNVTADSKIWSPPSVLGSNKLPDHSYRKYDEEKLNYIVNKPPIQKPPIVSSTPWIANGSKENRVLNLAVNKFEKSSPISVSPQSPNIPPYKERTFNPVPLQNGHAKRLSLPQALPAPGPLSAPNLVRKLENLKQQMNNHIEEEELPSKIDAERLQIEFYEKQIKEHSKKFPKSSLNGQPARRFSEHIPENYTYTVTDFTPSIPVSTFVPVIEKSPSDEIKLDKIPETDYKPTATVKPVMQKPDIEDTNPQPLKKLPDLVLDNKSETKESPVEPTDNIEEMDANTKSEVHLTNNKSDLHQTEYKAVARVMKGPVSQQATLNTKSTQETYEKRDNAAKSLKGVLQKFSSPKLDVIKQMEKKKAFMQAPPEQPAVDSMKNSYNHPQNGNDISVPLIKYNNVTTTPKMYNGIHNIDHKNAIPHHRFKNKCSSDAVEISENGESIVSSKLQFSPMNRMQFASPINTPNSHTPSPTGLSRSESWHQLALQHAMKPPSPRISPGSKPSTRAKSMHLLALPKQFEAGISKDKIQEKKKTVEAYFTENGSTVETIATKKIIKVSSETTENISKTAKKQVSPFAKFKQLDKQNSVQSTPSSPKTPLTPTGGGSPLFKFTDPQLQNSASHIKERLLQWCRDKTQEYENVKLDNFSTSWSDGLAFCALVHHFLPDEFDYSKLEAQKRRYNFTLAFKVADEKAGIYPLLDVEDMVTMRKPDWKCVFTYVQAIHRRFKDQD